jgi:transcriptional regulator with XRE-family HTH domain
MERAMSNGVRFDCDRFNQELGKRGLTGELLAGLAGVDKTTISRMRRGRPVRQKTVSKVVHALLSAPLIPGAELLA